jgi:uncharacterized protein (DUF1501 family)
MIEIGHFDTLNCQGMTRRSFLQAGALGALELTLPHLLAQRAADATMTGTARSVILLWLWGGPSHFETFDPKPDAPSGVRGPFAPIRTKAPGVYVCELFPQLAAVADQFAMIRSLNHDQSDHNVGGTVALTGVPAGGRIGGGAPVPGVRKPTVGSLVAYLKGMKPGQWPPFIAVGPVCKVSGAPLSGQDAANLSASCEPFRVEYSMENGVQMPPSLQLPKEISVRRLSDRRRLLGALDALQRQTERAAEVNQFNGFYEQAFALMTSAPTKKAFDIESEPRALRDRYGRTQFGQSCLLARRLVEVGVPFVQVNWSAHAEDEQTSGGDGGWDGHWRLFEFMQERFAWILDTALSALLTDLRERGLLDSTLVIAMGEFGRTPKINGCGGRDHWPGCYSALLAGGGVRGGNVIGASDDEGAYPADRALHPTSLHATVLHTLGLDRIPLNEVGVGVEAETVTDLF